MIYEKFSKPLRLSLFLTTLIVSPAVFAQDPNYAPPPMFQDMTPPMVRPPAKDGNIVQPMASPRSSAPIDSNAQPAKRVVVTPRVSVDPDSTRTTTRPSAPPVAPVVPQAPVAPVAPPAVAAPTQPKFMQPIIEEPKAAKPSKPAVKAPVVAKPDVKPVAPPAAPPAVAPPPPAAPPVEQKPSPEAKAPPPPVEIKAPTPPATERDPKVSAITGPKTMPAVLAPDVAKTPTFEQAAPAVAEPTIYERHQTEVEQKKTEETLTPVAPLPNVTPASFEPSEQGILKKSIAFTPGQIGLVPADLDPISAGVANEINADGKDDWRVQIRAYATPYGTGLSSDRRIALNRALSLRTALITRGVSASRIDVLAEGLQGDNSKPGDRIDIYLYGPAQE